MKTSHGTVATFAGFGSILLWSSTMAALRLVSERMGAMTTGAVTYLLAGGVGSAILLSSRSARAALRQGPPLYLWGCGGIFVVYTVCLTAAVGLATGRPQVMEVGVINYLWPGLTLALSVPILGHHPRATLWLGIVAAFAGAALALLPVSQLDPIAFWANVRANAWPYVLALAGAVTWALYSNLVRRWATAASGNPVPLFILASGALMAVLAPLAGERLRWSPTLIPPVLYMSLGPGLLAYVLWERGMRRGRVTVLASAAYLTPLLSMGVSWWLLGIDPGWKLWAASALVVSGAIVCKLSIREAEAPVLDASVTGPVEGA